MARLYIVGDLARIRMRGRRLPVFIGKYLRIHTGANTAYWLPHPNDECSLFPAA
jgi:hypothetical protein